MGNENERYRDEYETGRRIEEQVEGEQVENGYGILKEYPRLSILNLSH